MKFEDSIYVKALYYDNYAFAVVNNTAYKCSADREISNETASVDLEKEKYDEEGYAKTPQEEWVSLGKCFISFNSAAAKIRSYDGSEYVYSRYAIMPLRKATYHLIPKEGCYVRLVKADGTIDTEAQVRGFVTYKKRYLKIWV